MPTDAEVLLAWLKKLSDQLDSTNQKLDVLISYARGPESEAYTIFHDRLLRALTPKGPST